MSIKRPFPDATHTFSPMRPRPPFTGDEDTLRSRELKSNQNGRPLSPLTAPLGIPPWPRTTPQSHGLSATLGGTTGPQRVAVSLSTCSALALLGEQACACETGGRRRRMDKHEGNGEARHGFASGAENGAHEFTRERANSLIDPVEWSGQHPRRCLLSNCGWLCLTRIAVWRSCTDYAVFSLLPSIQSCV